MSDNNLVGIQEKIKEIIISVADFELTQDSIDTGENGITKLGLNSLAMIKMMVEVEKIFDIEIDMEETDPQIWSSVTDLSGYISEMRQGGQ